jgi:hypothetical protein
MTNASRLNAVKFTIFERKISVIILNILLHIYVNKDKIEIFL